MRRLSYVLWLLLISLLAQAAAAAPLRITYTTTGNMAAQSGCIGCSSVPFAGSVILEFPNGGAPTVGGAIDFGGVITVVSGEMHTTGAPLQLYTSPGVVGEITSLLWPAGATSFPFGTGFVNFIAPGFSTEGTIVPGSFAMDVNFFLAADTATGGHFGTEFSRQVVPEPSTGLLLGIGLVTLAARRSRRG